MSRRSNASVVLWFDTEQSTIDVMGKPFPANRASIWGRVRYPSGGDRSFGFVVPGGQVTLAYGDGQILGDCGVGVQQWHWTGRGTGSTAVFEVARSRIPENSGRW